MKRRVLNCLIYLLLGTSTVAIGQVSFTVDETENSISGRFSVTGSGSGTYHPHTFRYFYDRPDSDSDGIAVFRRITLASGSSGVIFPDGQHADKVFSFDRLIFPSFDAEPIEFEGHSLEGVSFNLSSQDCPTQLYYSLKIEDTGGENGKLNGSFSIVARPSPPRPDGYGFTVIEDSPDFWRFDFEMTGRCDRGFLTPKAFRFFPSEDGGAGLFEISRQTLRSLRGTAGVYLNTIGINDGWFGMEGILHEPKEQTWEWDYDVKVERGTASTRIPVHISASFGDTGPFQGNQVFPADQDFGTFYGSFEFKAEVPEEFSLPPIDDGAGTGETTDPSNGGSGQPPKLAFKLNNARNVLVLTSPILDGDWTVERSNNLPSKSWEVVSEATSGSEISISLNSGNVGFFRLRSKP